MLFSAVLGQFKPDSGCDNSGDPLINKEHSLMATRIQNWRKNWLWQVNNTKFYFPLVMN